MAIKLALEMAALHPVSLLAFFSCVGLGNGESLEHVRKQIRKDFAPTLTMEYLMWAPVDICSFAFVPVRYQLLLADTVCFAESIALSLVKANGMLLPGLPHGDTIAPKDRAAVGGTLARGRDGSMADGSC